MAITPANLTSGLDSADQTSYATASITPTAGSLVLVSISSWADVSQPPTIPTLSGCGLTWAQVATVVITDAGVRQRRLTTFRALGTPSTGALTFDFGVETQTLAAWVVDEFSGTAITGADGADAIVQAETNQEDADTSAFVILAAHAADDNLSYGVVATSATPTITPGSGFTELADESGAIESIYHEIDGDPNWTLGAAVDYGAVGVEVAVRPVPAVTSLTPDSGTAAGGTSVVVAGSGFLGATAVKFGATDATDFVVDSDVQITATSPAHAGGVVDVTVTTPGGTSSTSGTGNDFLYTEEPWQAVPGAPHLEMAVEVAWASTPDDDTPFYLPITNRVREIHLRVYRQTELDEFQTGEFYVVCDNRDRELEPFNTSSSLSPNVLPRKRIRYRVRYDGAVYTRFVGFLRQLPIKWERHNDATVTLVAADYGLVLNRAQITTSGYPAEKVDVRIGRVLDAIGVPAGDRALDTSDHTCAAIPAAAAGEESQVTGGLAHCAAAAQSDGGYVFISRAGKVTFHNKRHRTDDEGTPAGTFGDDAGEIPYRPSLVGQTDDATLWNRFTVLDADGTRETSTDTASINAYWDSRRDDFQSLLAYPGEAASLASLFVWRYKDPRLRFPSLVTPLVERSGLDIDVLLAADVGERFTVNRRPPGGGSAISEEVHVEGIQEDCTVAGPYALHLDLSPADPELDEWIVGTSQLGVDTYVGR